MPRMTIAEIEELMRAGGTISGPALMLLADTAAYFLTLALAGPVPSAATANLDIHFLVRPKPGDIVAIATMLRLGRRLAVSKVDLRSGDDLVAHATVTYALPPEHGRAG
jgi:acyl-coenzyme A thioesterase PaaI-like protein